MIKEDRIWTGMRLLGGGLLIVMLLMLVVPAWADNDRNNPDATSTSDASAAASANAFGVTTSNATGGVSTGGAATVNNNARALSLSGSGMEIRDCIATHAVLFGLWQGTHINKPCVADKMDARGQYEQAAKLRCSMWSYKRVYGGGKKCIDAITLTKPPDPPDPPKVALSGEAEEEDDLRYMAQQQEINFMQEELANVMGQLQAHEQSRAIEAQRVQQQPPRYSDEQKAKVAKLLSAKQE